MARPSKYETHVLPRMEAVKGWARDGLTDEQIANKLNIHVDTLYEYKKKHKEFSESLKENKDEADFRVEEALYQKALGGDTTAMIFWLKNRQSAKWRDKQDLQHTGNMTNTNIDVSKLSDKELDKILKQVDEDE